MGSEPGDSRHRLAAEAEFQNRRVAGKSRGETEPRDRFYYLAARAQRRYEEKISAVAGQRVLVVGCSEYTVRPLASKGAFVTGIDVAQRAIERLSEAIERDGLGERAAAMVMDAEKPDFPPRTFDLICCSGVLHHLDIEKCSPAWARILKGDGRVAMIEPMAWNPAAAAYRAVTPSMRTRDEHPLKPRDLRVMRRHFEEVEMESFVLTSVLSLPFAYLPERLSLKERSNRLLEAVDDRLLRWLPPLRYLCWTSVIELRRPRSLEVRSTPAPPRR